MTPPCHAEWWRHAVVSQIYSRCFAGGDNGLVGMTVLSA